MTTKRNRARSWRELSRAQRISAIVGAIVQTTLMVAALRDLRRRPATAIRGPKWAWTVAAFVNFVGPLSYFLFGRKR